MKPHKHAELIKAWADGAEIEIFNTAGWGVQANPRWDEGMAYRIKPEPKHDVVRYLKKSAIHGWYELNNPEIQKEGINCATLKLTFDGETGELKSAEVLK